MEITYKLDHLPGANEIIEVYKSSGINRPVHDKHRIEQMYANSNLIVTAWHNEQLVGIARSLTDFCYCCYLSDLAVRLEYQSKGIGKKLIALTKEKLGEQVTLILVSAPAAVNYYPKIGMDRIEHSFSLKRLK